MGKGAEGESGSNLVSPAAIVIASILGIVERVPLERSAADGLITVWFWCSQLGGRMFESECSCKSKSQVCIKNASRCIGLPSMI